MEDWLLRVAEVLAPVIEVDDVDRVILCLTWEQPCSFATPPVGREFPRSRLGVPSLPDFFPCRRLRSFTGLPISSSNLSEAKSLLLSRWCFLFPAVFSALFFY